MPVLLRSRATPACEDDSALVRVLEASIETLKAENEILRHRLVAAEARAARDIANAEQAIAEFSAITKRLRARAAETSALAAPERRGCAESALTRIARGPALPSPASEALA
jgi:inorganic triphosphatase YgiF